MADAAKPITPIRLYTYQTPNGHKASIMLEETGLPYEVHLVDIEAGAQHQPDFLSLNPNNKIPVIVDPDRDRTVFESGAILIYLANRAGRFVQQDEALRTLTLQWILFQAAHVGPTLGQLWNYKIFVEPKLPPVIERFERETRRVLKVLDGQLRQRPFLVAEYGLADIMTWPWIHAAQEKIGVAIADYPALVRWYREIAARPAVQRGLAVPVMREEAA
ncbi:MAG TPA: glutathione S-transferase N-terminal domain-containing protein [Ferrovibrio sp.]|uniref:glutathione S-transferase family protein n=1 Tax=Ferrovibrio sp. TaxID=1917215 RepID=UPI002ED4826C